MARPPVEPPSRPCRQYALWLLGRREWSAKELADRLKQKGYPLDAIEDCLVFCQQHGLQSDARYAATRTRFRARSHGNRRIALELTQKGVEQDMVTDALATEAGDELERAWHAAARFEGKPMTPELNAKVWRFLVSRGFSGDSVKSVLRTLKQTAPSGE